MEERRRSIESYLELAKVLAVAGNGAEAERLYKNLLRAVESIAGEDCPMGGSIMIELADLYEKQGRDREAEQLWERIRIILISQVAQALGASAERHDAQP